MGQICSSSGDWIDEQGRPAASQAVGPASNRYAESRLLSATFIGTSSRDLLTFALGVGVWTQTTFECNLCY